jgi:hypothetical protein
MSLEKINLNVTSLLNYYYKFIPKNPIIWFSYKFNVKSFTAVFFLDSPERNF